MQQCLFAMEHISQISPKSPLLSTLCRPPLCRLLGNPPCMAFLVPHGFCIDPVLLSIKPLRIGHLDRPIPTMHIPTMYNFWDEALLASWSCNPLSLRLSLRYPPYVIILV